MDSRIRDNAELHRYELEVDRVKARYRPKPGVITFIHTEVPERLAGQGLGSHLARHVLDAARAEGLRVIPVCPFIAAWMKKHPEYGDLRVSAETREDGL